MVAHALDEVGDRHAGKAAGVGVGIAEEAEEGDQTAVAPAEDADPVGVDPGVVVDRPVAGGEGVLDLETAVVDVLVHAPAVAGGAPVLGRDHDVALGHQLAHDVGVVGRTS